MCGGDGGGGGDLSSPLPSDASERSDGVVISEGANGDDGKLRDDDDADDADDDDADDDDDEDDGKSGNDDEGGEGGTVSLDAIKISVMGRPARAADDRSASLDDDDDGATTTTTEKKTAFVVASSVEDALREELGCAVCRR